MLKRKSQKLTNNKIVTTVSMKFKIECNYGLMVKFRCKLENDNSINVEVPFIKERRAERVKRLKKLIELGDQYDTELLTLVE